MTALSGIEPTPMHCREFESRLNDILDNRGQPRADGQLVAHAQVCDPCRQLLAGQQALFAGLKHRPLAATVSTGFADRVVAQSGATFLVGNRVSPARAWWAVATVLSTAAAVLLIVSLVWQARRGNVPRLDNNVVNRDPATPAHERLAPNGRAPGSNLAMSQSDWLIEAPRLPSHIRGSYRGTLDNLAVALPETVQRLDEVEHYAPGIRPIRISFGLMFDALWRTLPGSRDEDRPTRTSYRAIELQQIA
jgi:hypothetical protein